MSSVQADRMTYLNKKVKACRIKEVINTRSVYRNDLRGGTQLEAVKWVKKMYRYVFLYARLAALFS